MKLPNYFDLFFWLFRGVGKEFYHVNIKRNRESVKSMQSKINVSGLNLCVVPQIKTHFGDVFLGKC